MNLGVVAGLAIVYALGLVRIYLSNYDLQRHLVEFRRALCGMATLLSLILIFAVWQSFQGDGNPHEGRILAAVTDHYATALGVFMVVLVGLMIQAWMLMGRLQRFVVDQDLDRQTRDQIARHQQE